MDHRLIGFSPSTLWVGDAHNLVLENQAKVVASDIFAEIGVKILWQSPRQCSAEAILITFSDEEPASLLPGSLAYAMPFEGTHIVVFYDRVKNRPGSVSCLLGHVISHTRSRTFFKAWCGTPRAAS